jgi:hypothetical protein
VRETLRTAWRSAVVRWLLLAVALVAAAGWYWRLQPVETVWGDVATWVGGLATSAGLIFAAYQIRLANLQRRNEETRRIQDEGDRRVAMARAVGVRSVVKQEGPDWFVGFTLHNGGDYPINDVVVVIIDPGAPVIAPERQQGTALEYVVGTVLPKETISEEKYPVHFTAEPAFGEITSLGAVLFTDTWGQHWARSTLGGLTPQEHPPRIC